MYISLLLLLLLLLYCKNNDANYNINFIILLNLLKSYAILALSH